MTPNVEAAKAFYALTFGWTYLSRPVPNGTYTLAFAPGSAEPVAGLFHWPAHFSGSNDWFAYFAVEDIALALRQAVVGGGMVLREPFFVEGVGKLAILVDAVGARLGYLEADRR